MTYNGINFLLSGNGTTVTFPPTHLISGIDVKGRVQLHEEIYDFEEELESYRKKLVKLYDTIISQYAVKEVDGEGKESLLMEDTIINGRPGKKPQITDTENYEKDLKALFDLEVPFRAKFTVHLLDGVEQIGKVEYRWLRELDLIRK